MPDHYQGQSLSRLEDSRFLTGRGTYIANAIPPGCLHLHVLRSPHGHARIDRLDASAARMLPGVVAIYTEADLAADGRGPLPCAVAIEFVEKLIVPPRPAMAKDGVRHVGDPVACVIAERLEAALEAAEAIEVDYTPLPAVVDAAAALAPDAPLLWPQVPGNSAYLYRRGDKAAVDAAMASAKHIVTADLLNSRVVVAPIETRAAIATYDAAQDRLHLILTGQGVHGIRRQLAEAVFRIPQDRLRVSAPDVGGGFGMKNFVYPEWVHLLFAARKLGRPVRWVSERVEDFVTSAQGRDFRAHARLALDEAGRFLALDVQAVANMGAYLSGAGPGSSTVSAGNAMGGVYAIPAVAMEVRGAFTNTPPIDAYRGAGKPEANYLIERLVDQAARETGIDAVELRRRNLISTFPHRTPTGMQIDGGRFVANLDDALRVADQQGYEARRQRSADAGLLRGWGLSCFLETARGAPGEVARVSFDADGGVSLAVGTMSNGQGHETTYPQVAADLLGLPITAFRYRQGPTCRPAARPRRRRSADGRHRAGHGRRCSTVPGASPRISCRCRSRACAPRRPLRRRRHGSRHRALDVAAASRDAATCRGRRRGRCVGQQSSDRSLPQWLPRRRGRDRSETGGEAHPGRRLRPPAQSDADPGLVHGGLAVNRWRC